MSCIFFKADVVLKFVDEEAPATIQPKTLYVPKPEIQVILMYARFISELLHAAWFPISRL